MLGNKTSKSFPSMSSVNVDGSGSILIAFAKLTFSVTVSVGFIFFLVTQGACRMKTPALSTLALSSKAKARMVDGVNTFL